MTTPLITVTEARPYIGIRPDDAQFDAHLTNLILVATTQIEEAIGMALTDAEAVEHFDTRRTHATTLDLYGTSETGVTSSAREQSFPLSGFMPREADGIAVYYDPQRVFGEDTLLPNTDLLMNWITGRLTVLRGLSEARAALRVVYSHGILPEDGTLSANAPVPLKEACRVQTAFLFKQRRTDNIGHDGDRAVSNDKSPSKFASWNSTGALCQEAKTLLHGYYRPRLGRG